MSLLKAELNAFCAALAGTTFVQQWGGAQVWKVGGKVFALAWFEPGRQPEITFKVSEIGWEVLREAAGCRPAPYMASRGLKWIQSFAKPGLSKKEVKTYLRASYDMVVAALPMRTKVTLGLEDAR